MKDASRFSELMTRIQILFESYPVWMVIAVSLVLAFFLSLFLGKILRAGLALIAFLLALAGVIIALSYLVEIVPAS